MLISHFHMRVCCVYVTKLSSSRKEAWEYWTNFYFVLGISLCRRWSFSTAFLDIFHFLLLSSGAPVHKPIFTMLWFTCFWVLLMIFGRTNCFGASGHFRYNILALTTLMCIIYSCVSYCHQLCETLQILLLLLALIAVPWMLFPKPFILKRLHIEVHYLLNVSFFPLF